MSLENNAVASSSKRKHKHKHKHNKQTLSQTLPPGDAKNKSDTSKGKSPFEHHHSSLRLSIAPKYSGDFIVGIKEKLDGMIMRYVSQLGGVLLAHWNHETVDDTVKIINECPYGVCQVHFESLVWAPKLGQKLHGTHSLSSPSHLSLLFNKTFNVSIPLQHIPQDMYYFEASDSIEEVSDSESDSDRESVGGVQVEMGRWKDKSTGNLVGEGGKGIKFTVIGLEVSNQMLSLTGSLLADPTNPPPPPSPPRLARDVTPEDDEDEEVDMAQSHVAVAAAAYDTSLLPVPVHAVKHEHVDEQFLSQRELKQKRKEEEKRKREARKARKEGQEILEMAELGAKKMVSLHVEGRQEGVKRKAVGGEREEKKKKKRT